MASIGALRELLRAQLGDIARLAKERRIQDEILDAALFNGLQAHNRFLTWDSLPPEEEQLVLLLAKARICRDKAAEYAMDPKLQAGAAFARDKTGNAYGLLQLAREYVEEYRETKQRLAAQLDGDITVGTITRESRTRRQIVPSIVAPRPQKPFIESAYYRYDATLRKGHVGLRWGRMTDQTVAFVRVYLSRQRELGNAGELLRTIYDLSHLAVPPLAPVQNTIPQLAQQKGEIEKTILPTGRWYVTAVAFNWNGLYTESDPVELDVVCYADVRATAFAVPNTAPLPALSTTTTTTTTTTSTTT